VESFSGSFRDGFLNVNWFLALEDARISVEALRQECKKLIGCISLGHKTPEQFLITGPQAPYFGRESTVTNRPVTEIRHSASGIDNRGTGTKRGVRSTRGDRLGAN
jgi:hypothetical protein